MTDPDLRRLRDLGEALKPAPDQPPFELRWRVLASIEGTRAPAAAVSRRKPLRRFRVAAAVGAFAACLALLTVAGSVGPNRYPLEKSHMLKLAAHRVAAAPAFSPRPDQFIYTESIAVYREVRPAGTVMRDQQVQVRAWRSVDGTHEGLIQTFAPEAWPAEWQGNPIPVCRPDSCRPAQSAAGLPTDAESMYHYLYRPDPGELPFPPLGVDERALNRAAEVLRLSQHLPAVQAALFQAMARIQGVTLRLDAVDVAGRHGIALAYTGVGNETELIFEPVTYKYLGVNRKMTWVYIMREQDHYLLLPDAAIREAVTRVEVVDRVGQR
ncbi:MAG TPA: CU044_5270 family protein [Candidatus Limnocylindrales bacterium]|nr:CU044_5270 family protein [Candidatus Limnocylindrales bacterium]